MELSNQEGPGNQRSRVEESAQRDVLVPTHQASCGGDPTTGARSSLLEMKFVTYIHILGILKKVGIFNMHNR